MQYRPEVDGLRAIAVLSVVFYHAGLLIFKGGFIGVDIFLVISGYLITTILLREMKEDSFSYLQFYERRARRILPALFFVMATTIPFAWDILLPKAFREYGGSLISTIFFGSNIQFWLEDSYVAEASMLKPFLHTWTLSLEEQFYIIFPVLLLVCWKYCRKYINVIFSVLFLASLVLAQWGSKHHVDASFYLIHTRMWELLAGSLLAKLEFDKGKRISHPVLNHVMPLSGIAMIIYAVLMYHEKIQHPSIYTALPVIGAALLVWFGGKGDLVSRILSSKIFVTTGLLSYSIYLWHQPVFAFARIYTGIHLSSSVIISCIALTLLLSFFTWKFIEGPFRDRKKISAGYLWKTLSYSSAALLVFGTTSITTDGFRSRLPKEFAKTDRPQFLAFKQNKKSCWGRPGFPKDVCRFGAETVVSLGDSSLASMLPVLSRDLMKSPLGLVDLTWGQCPYHSGIDHRIKGCAEINSKRDEVIDSLQEKKIFIVGYDLKQLNTSVSPEGRKVPFEVAAKSVTEKIKKILSRGHRVVLLKQMPPINQNTVQLLKFAHSRLPASQEFTTKLSSAGKPSDVIKLDMIYSALPKSENLIIVDPKSSFCDLKSDKCWANEGLKAYFSDQFNHLSSHGAEIVLRQIKKEMHAKWGITF